MVLVPSMTLLVSSNALSAEERCYHVTASEPILEASCGALQVHVTSSSCSSPSTDVVDFGERAGKIDCREGNKKLQVRVTTGTVVTELAKTMSPWGETTYKVGAAQFSRKGAAAVTVAKAESDEGSREPASIAENPKVQPTPRPAPVAKKAEPVAAPEPKPEPKPESKSEPKSEKNDAALVEAPKVDAVKAEAPKADDKKGEVKIGDVVTKFSGFAFVETEIDQNFGYSSTGPADFTQSQNSQTSFLTNLQVDVTKGPTQFTSIFEIGEVLDGDSASGGAAGARQKIVEVRNLFIGQDLSSTWNLKLGLLPIATDPGMFIFNDHLAAQSLTYHTEKTNLNFWHGTAAADKPGTVAASHVNPDNYYGLQTQFTLTAATKLTAYGVYRSTIESLYDNNRAATVNGRSRYQWGGATIENNMNDRLRLQGTYIYNAGQFDGDAGAASDVYSASLVDANVIYKLPESRIDLSLDGVMTSGSSDSVASGQTVATIGKRKSFSSPDPGCAYLLTIATSDGADDAPGAPKQAVIGNLSQANGLQIYVFKIAKAWTDQFSTFAKLGVLRSTASNSATGSMDMGNEVDLEANYEMSPGTVLQIDAARLTPGAYYTSTTREPPTFFGTRIKFSF